jgi:hypothetical protein
MVLQAEAAQPVEGSRESARYESVHREECEQLWYSCSIESPLNIRQVIV